MENKENNNEEIIKPDIEFLTISDDETLPASVQQNVSTQEEIKQYKSNPPNKMSYQRKKHLIQGIVCVSVAGATLVILGILMLTVLKDKISETIVNEAGESIVQSTSLGNTLYFVIVIVALLGVLGILFITGKFDKNLKPNNLLQESLNKTFGVETHYIPYQGLKLDEVNDLLNDNLFQEYSDYLVAVTDSKVRFEASYLNSFKTYEVKEHTKLIETKKYDNQVSKYDIPNTGDTVEEIYKDSGLEYSIKESRELENATNGTMIIFRNILNNPFTNGDSLTIHTKNISLLDFKNLGSYYQHNKEGLEVFTTNDSKAKDYLQGTLLSRIEKLSKLFNKGVIVHYEHNNLYFYINKYRMDLMGIADDRKLTQPIKQKLIYKTLDTIGLINSILKLKGDYKSPYNDLYKSFDKDHPTNLDQNDDQKRIEEEIEKEILVEQDANVIDSKENSND